MTARPHDALFKAALAQPSDAAGLLRATLPAPIVRAIDWSTLALAAGSFVGPDLEDRHTDLLFRARLGDTTVRLYLLLEHQSRTHRDMALRMHVYMGRIWERFRKDEPSAPLPVIVPVVISHDPRGWSGPRSMADQLDPRPSSIPQLGRLVPQFDLHIEDLRDLSNDDLRARTLATFTKLALAALRDGRTADDIVHTLRYWSDAIHELAQTRSGMDALHLLFTYVAHTANAQLLERIHATIIEHTPQAEPATMTIASRLLEEGRQEGRKQGRQEGRQEGRQQGRVETVLRFLQLKFGPLDAVHVGRVRAASDAELEQIVERVVQADDLDAVFAES